MQNIIIIGARGFGREYYDGISHSPGYGKKYTIKGFLDDKSDALNGYEGYGPILDSVENYIPEEGDIFTCALGDAFYRRKYTEMILEKGGKFMSLISPKADISPQAKIGQGVMIAAYCSISADTVIGDFCTLQRFCTIGHDAVIGNWCSLESYCFMGGFSRLGEGVNMHTRATILPHVRVGNGATVGAGAVCIRKVKAATTVYGNPAVRLKW